MSTLAAAPARGNSAVRNQYATIPIARLRVGTMLRSPIYDDRPDRDVLLLSSGTTISAELMERLEARGISQVRVLRSELERLMDGVPAAPTRPAAARLARPARQPDHSPNAAAGGDEGPAVNAFINKVKQHGAKSYDNKKVTQFAENYCQSMSQIETLFSRLTHGDIARAAQVVQISSESLVRIADDMDLFVSLGMSPAADRYPCKHSLHTAMLAMSVGTVLELKRDELIELGIGCLVHDAGMLHIDLDLVRSDRVLDHIQFLEITKHPIITFDLLKDAPDVPLGSRMVAYQMHERLNGSGYPRNRQAIQIHPLSKVASVADVFIALVSPRPHRPGMLPYHAIEQIIHGARSGLYDRDVVRALLHTISLFPIGSFVEMSDGRVGKVVRANGTQYTRPVVELWTPDDSSAAPEVVDLSGIKDLEIIQPLAELPFSETDVSPTEAAVGK